MKFLRNHSIRQAAGRFSAAAILFGGVVLLAFAGENTVTSGQDYDGQVRQDYSLKVAPGSFLPSNAQSSSGGFISPDKFPVADYCGGCHSEIHAQWRQSAHSNSFRAPFYLRNVELLIKAKGIEYSRHCEGCHNPIALFSGALTPKSKIKRWFDDEGVTCMVCHSIQKVQSTQGTGSYVMGVPTVMLNSDGSPRTDTPSDAEILKHPELHKAALMKDFYRTPEFCSVCHKAALPKLENGYKWLRAFSVYDEWQESSWSRQSPVSFYKKDTAITCLTCHMPLVEGKEDAAVKKGRLISHRWLGANTAIPTFYNFSEQLQKTQEFLKDVVSIDIFALAKTVPGRGEAMICPLNRESYSLFPGEVVTANLVIQNKRAGHSLVPEQRDFYEAWVEFTATDAGGKEFYQSGMLDENGNLDEYAHSYTNRLIEAKGKWVDLHQVWDSRVRVYDNTIMPGASDLVRYRFRIPPEAKSPITLSARLRYRRFRRSYSDFIMQQSRDFPITDLGSGSVALTLGARQPALSVADPAADVMRWNNYGIALFGQQQYWKAKEAFEKVIQLKPDYADAYINVAVSEILTLVDTRPYGGDGPGTLSISNQSSEKFEQALNMLDHALKLDPPSMRAMYYQGLIHRFQNKLDLAAAEQTRVLSVYPRCRLARQEVGYIDFLQGKYDAAREQFEALLDINPDHLTGHYYLSLVYAKLGMKEKAEKHGKIYAEELADPSVGAMAQEFLRGHPAVGNELFPYHVHDDSLRGKYVTDIGAPLP
jgi:tetratricopeptide (TPR) repeat protein